MPRKSIVVTPALDKTTDLLTCSVCGACGQGEGWIGGKRPRCPVCAEVPNG